MDRTLTIPSVTGIDVELHIAGPGGRSYAFIIDWHIRALIAGVWILMSALAYWAVSIAQAEALDLANLRFFALAPAAALYLLYHPVLEIAMRGSTPGKRIAGLRIVRRDGGVPGTGALLVRNLFRLIDSMPILYGLGLASTLLTKQSVRIGDMAAGTLLVYDRETGGPRFDGTLAGSGIDRLGLERAELVRDLLSRWPELRPDVRTDFARRLLEQLGCAAREADEPQLYERLEKLLQ